MSKSNDHKTISFPSEFSVMTTKKFILLEFTATQDKGGTLENRVYLTREQTKTLADQLEKANANNSSETA